MENQEKEKEEKENLLIMNNNKSLAVELKNLTRNAGMKSSIHCLPNISDRKTFSTVKVVWFLITATSWILWLIQTYGLNQLYNEHNVITNYKQGVDSDMEFPGNLKFSLYFYLFDCIIIQTNKQKNSDHHLQFESILCFGILYD